MLVLGDTLGALVDLVLPAECAGCAEVRCASALCPACSAALASARPQRVRPDPPPVGLPPTYALAGYGGALRGALLQYKEKNRHGLAAPLGRLLADVVLRALPPGVPAVLVPVPATAVASRRRMGDHMVRLAEQAARRLRRGGLPALVVRPLRAQPKPDSAELSAARRALLAQDAFALRERRLPQLRAATRAGAAVVVVDDIVTTGATLAAMSDLLRGAGVPVTASAVLAATQRRVAVLHRT